MKLIVGLWNPGSQYRETRHNVGFLAVESYGKTTGFPDFTDSEKYKCLLSEKSVSGEKTVLMKPLTYMNLSGDSVAPFVAFYKLDPKKDVLVLSDDIDMEFWKIRYREKGSSGGQNGLKSIASRLGTEEFSRLKIGIGRDSRFETADWVLSKFKDDEMAELSATVFSEVKKMIDGRQGAA